MTYVQFPYVVLTQLGRDLSDVGEKLASKQHGAADCDGLGGDEQSRIQDAIGHFRDEWKTSVNTLIEDIGKWSGLSKAIGDMVQQFDAQVATALRPPAG